MKIKNITKDVPVYNNKTQLGNYDKGRDNCPPGLITLHIADGSYNGTCSWFCNEKAVASSHFVVSKKGDITQCVNIEDTAFINGTSRKPESNKYYKHATNGIVKKRSYNANLYTVGIEFEGYYDKENDTCPMTPEQEEAAVFLIVHIYNEIKEKFGNKLPIDRSRICGHYEVNPRTKPFCGKGFPYDRIIQKARKELGL